MPVCDALGNTAVLEYVRGSLLLEGDGWFDTEGWLDSELEGEGWLDTEARLETELVNEGRLVTEGRLLLEAEAEAEVKL